MTTMLLKVTTMEHTEHEAVEAEHDSGPRYMISPFLSKLVPKFFA